jgi:hypothetical protein
MLRGTALAFGLVVVLSAPCTSRGQGVFPGGWEPQFGYQVVVGPGAVGYGAGATFGMGQPAVGPGFGYGGYGGFNPYGMGFGYPGAGVFNRAPNQIAGLPQADQAVNGLGTFAESVRHATRKRRGR